MPEVRERETGHPGNRSVTRTNSVNGKQKRHYRIEIGQILLT